MKARVLIVDDEALLVRTLSRAFLDAGFEVVTAGSAEAAHQLLRSQQPFDLLFLDNRLPGKSGLDLLQELGPLPETHVVLMTAYGTSETHQRSLQLGVDLYLKKPFDLGRLLTQAAELLEKGAKA